MDEIFRKFHENGRYSLNQNQEEAASEEHGRLASIAAATAPKGAPRVELPHEWAGIMLVVFFVCVCRMTQTTGLSVCRSVDTCFRRCREVSVFRLYARTHLTQSSHFILQRSGPRLHPQYHSLGLCICLCGTTHQTYSIPRARRFACF